jgi:hypothetical protein
MPELVGPVRAGRHEAPTSADSRKPYLADPWSWAASPPRWPRSATVSGASNTISAPARPCVAAWMALPNALARRHSRGCRATPNTWAAAVSSVQGQPVAGIGQVPEPHYPEPPGHDCLAQLQPLVSELWRGADQSREVPTQSCQTSTGCKPDGNGCARVLGGHGRCVAGLLP